MQELVSNLSLGTLPRSIWVSLEDDLVDTCKPGDDVIVVGRRESSVNFSFILSSRIFCKRQDLFTTFFNFLLNTCDLFKTTLPKYEKKLDKEMFLTGLRIRIRIRTRIGF
jgi:hypothetical protein